MLKIYLTIWLCMTSFQGARAEDSGTPFEKVFGVIAQPKIYSTTWSTLLRRLDPLCDESTRAGLESIKKGNVECINLVGATSFTVTIGERDRILMIAASFEGAANCAYMKKTLTRNFGKPTATSSECNHRWWLRTPEGRPLRFVGMGASTQKNEAYFSIGVEQGP